MRITIHKSKKRKLTLEADNASDHDFLNTVAATFLEGGQLQAFPDITEADAVALDPCKRIPKRKATQPRSGT